MRRQRSLLTTVVIGAALVGAAAGDVFFTAALLECRGPAVHGPPTAAVHTGPLNRTAVSGVAVGTPTAADVAWAVAAETGRCVQVERLAVEAFPAGGGGRVVAPQASSLQRGARFHTLGECEARLAALVAKAPHLVAPVAMWPLSVEGRAIRGVRVSTTPHRNDPSKAEVLLTGGYHAREWAAVEAAVGVAEALVAGYYANARVRRVLQAVELIVVPIANPDGVEHTHAQGGDRYWRKNRRRNGDGSYGVDLNRNYPFQWGRVPGSSGVPVADTYRGPAPASEPETAAVVALLQDTRYVAQPGAFFSLHSFGRQLLLPPGYAAGTTTPQNALMTGLFAAGEAAMRAAGGLAYDVMNASAAYVVSGDTVDYAHQLHGGLPGVTVELRPASGECCGFVLPTAEIAAAVREQAALVLHTAEYVGAAVRHTGRAERWWEAAPVFNASFVAAADSDRDGTVDVFDLCPDTANAAANALTGHANASSGAVLWPVDWDLPGDLLLGLRRLAPHRSLCSGDLFSVFGGAVGAAFRSRPLRLFATPSAAAFLPELAACNATAAASVEAGLAALLRATAGVALPSFAVEAHDIAHRGQPGVGSPRCGLTVALAALPTAAAVDDVFRAVVRGSGGGAVLLSDAAFDGTVPVDPVTLQATAAVNLRPSSAAAAFPALALLVAAALAIAV